MKSNKGVLKYYVIDKFFDEQVDAERYALEMTNPVSSKVWINLVMYYDDNDFFCLKSYTL